jgi:hypothetical protein
MRLSLVLAFLLSARPASAQLIYGYQADLSGAEVVPSTPSMGLAHFDAVFPSCGGPTDSMVAQVWYSFLPVVPTGCGLYRGEHGMNGPLIHRLFGGFFPEGASVTIHIDQSECEYFWSNQVYVVIQTDLYPEGEIRGQLRPAPDSVTPSTWGQIKTLYQSSLGSFSGEARREGGRRRVPQRAVTALL